MAVNVPLIHISELSEQTTAADTDCMVIGGADVKKIKWSTIVSLIKTKLGIGEAATKAVANNLTTESAGAFLLDAYQGKLLSDAIDKINNDFLDKTYPVGSIFMSANKANPSTYFGGTWVAWGTGRVPVGVDSSQTEFSTVEKTGGEKTHKLTVSELASHGHSGVTLDGQKLGVNNGTNVTGLGVTYTGGKAYGTMTTANSGGSTAHNNLQPYITCYMWKRTA